MSIESPNDHYPTREERANVSAYLKKLGGFWEGTPNYETYSQKHSHLRLNELYDAIYKETDVDLNKLNAAANTSHAFIEDMYANYNGTPTIGDISRVFLVTRRAHRFDSTDEYESESHYHIPLASHQFGVDADIRMRSMYGWPPAVIDTYTKSTSRAERGALMLAPLYADMMADLANHPISLNRAVHKALYESIQLARHKLKADIVGLGALLPKITQYGQSMHTMDNFDNLTTTTGHGGTVYLITETVRKVIEETSTKVDNRVGVIGGVGSIGWSSISAIRDMDPAIELLAYDKRNEVLAERIQSNGYHNVSLATGAIDVLNNTNVIVTAITEQIDLDNIDPEKALDLQGKVIIDDSQPGCFHREQVEARGGHLVWVVGSDESENKLATRDGRYTGGIGYNYGDSSGLYGATAEFGCGLEVAAIARTQEYDSAIDKSVRPQDVKRIGALFRATGFTVAPFQSFGKPVEID